MHLINLKNLEFLSVKYSSHSVIIENLSRLTQLHLICCFQKIKISNLNNLKNVTMDECNIDQEEKIKIFEIKNLTYLDIDGFQHNEKMEERLKLFYQEQMLIDGCIQERKLIQFNHLTHLILINNKRPNHLHRLKYLQKITIGCDNMMDDKKKIQYYTTGIPNARKEFMKNEEAKLKYGKYLVDM